jgi:hypothetical protein
LVVLSITVIILINLNNYFNIFLCEESIRKINLKAEEKLYKKVLFAYFCIIGSLIMFFNEITLVNMPMSVFVLALQIIYTIALIVIHPYKQSLRVHSITLLINQMVFIVFLVFINLINLIKDMNELLIIILGYFITGCCGFLMILTGVRLYYELRFGEAMEKKIQKEREKEEEMERKRKEEKLEMKKKQFKEVAKLKMKKNAKEIERAKNQFLFENQVKQD